MIAEPTSNWLLILVATLSAFFVALLGGLLTDTGPWYRNLTKPSWQPPDWLFAPAWTVIFALIATAAVVAWQAAPDAASRRLLVTLYIINAILNVGWSLVFFRLRRPDWALVELAVFWLSILALLIANWRVDRTAGLLLVPYIAWVTFAGMLNYTVMALNPSR